MPTKRWVLPKKGAARSDQSPKVETRMYVHTYECSNMWYVGTSNECLPGFHVFLRKGKGCNETMAVLRVVIDRAPPQLCDRSKQGTPRGHACRLTQAGHHASTRTCEWHGLVDVAPRHAVAAVLADPREVVLVLVRRGELQDLGSLLKNWVQRLQYKT